MKTKVVTSLARGSGSEAANALVRDVHSKLGGEAPSLALVFASTAQPLGALMSELAARWAPGVVLGASTAGEFTEAGDASKSVSVFAVKGDLVVRAAMATGLKQSAEAAVADAISKLPREVPGYPHRTALLLLDPLAGNGEEATLIAASLLGDDVRLAGGAAGDDLGMKTTWVGCGDAAASDAVVVAVIFSKAPLGVGVCHGHKPISKPLKVTRAKDNVVFEVDGRPAWSVWADATRAHAREMGLDPDKLAPSELGAYLLRYEAGLSTGDGYKIRAPLGRQADGSLSFACGIPEGAVIQITESVPERQVASARTAAKNAREQIGNVPVAGALVFDCICRKLILGDQFATAVRGISHELGDAPLAGFETYGEIALDAGEMSGFHNTTTVVLAFPA